MKSSPWSRKELILALDLYVSCEGVLPNTRDPEVAALTSTLADLSILEAESMAYSGRSRASIIHKLSNFRAIDPSAKKAGKKGFPHGGKLDKEIWKEFAGNKAKLQRAVKGIRDEIRQSQQEIEPVRANLHVLRLLGDELIGSPRLAIFELVKNAYDADATSAKVTLDLDGEPPGITVRDDGCGMSLETIRDGWLQIGTPYKRTDPSKRTELGRLPLGEKGVGRLAAFKLGNRLEMITREKGGPEYHLVMDLDSIFRGGTADSRGSVEDIRVRVKRVEKNKVFRRKDRGGTLIRIRKLRTELDWTKRELRELQRLINSMSSPFEQLHEFKAKLTAPGREGELDDILNIKEFVEHAMWKFTFRLNSNGRFRWTLNFNPPEKYRGLQSRSMKSGQKGFVEKLEIEPRVSDSDIPTRPPRGRLFYNSEDLEGIGPIRGRFYIYDLRGTVLKHLGATKSIKMMLQNQGGVRVYRDGVRVFNYGEPNNDWLDLNLRRVNKPGRTLATNSFISAIHLSLEKSYGLKEKTNREGFDENEYFYRFKDIITSVIETLNRIRQEDREKLDLVLKGDSVQKDAPVRFQKAVDEILSTASKAGIKSKIEQPLEKVKKEYETLRNVVVSSGAGLNLSIVFHEVEREVLAIAEGIKKEEPLENIKLRAENLTVIIHGFGQLLRKTARKKMKVSALIKRVFQLNRSRFTAHKITWSSPVLSGEETDFEIYGALNFYLMSLMNLIDNAIYWVRRRSEIEDSDIRRAIQVRTLPDWAAEGPAMAVIDNGSGFSISPEEAMRAYSSTRSGGMGLGLFFASRAMEANNGELIIPESVEDLDIETALDGAAVVMRFGRIK